MLQTHNDNINKQCGGKEFPKECKSTKYSDQENVSLEKGFRGFKKSPLVLCERLDLSPFLNKHLKRSLKMESTKIRPKLERLIKDCSVILIRENLEQLKENINKTIKKALTDSQTSMLTCQFCNKIYSSAKRFQNHNDNKHMIEYKTEQSKPQKRVSFSEQVIVHELKQYHHCRKCPKIYEDYKSLKLHMKRVHKKRRCYICFYCNKDFADRMFFKMHIKLHCDVCGTLFPNKKIFNEHRRRVCGVIKKYECKNCKDVYFSFLHLKDHSYSHEGHIFVCDICKEQCRTKCEILHHIQFLHCKIRPKTLYDTTNVGSNFLYSCNSCEESFNHKEIIENHVISLPDLQNSLTTGYKDYYFCDQCSEQFETETSMLEHKWTHYLNSSEDCEKIIAGKRIRNVKKLVKYNKNVGNVHGKSSEDKCQADTSLIPNLLSSEISKKDEPNKISLKQTYNINEQLPLSLQPKLVLKKIEISKVVSKPTYSQIPTNLIDLTNLSHNVLLKIADSAPNVTANVPKMVVGWGFPPNIMPKKPIVDPTTKKTIISKYQCKECKKYYSTNYCLNRHIQRMHEKKENRENLQCPICEEVFVWPSLLQSHNCIRMTIPEMPFEDARPEIQFDNLQEFQTNGVDDDNDECMNNTDFEMPAPIVELTEYEGLSLIVNNGGSVSYDNRTHDNKNYKLIVQEVPIEF